MASACLPCTLVGYESESEDPENSTGDVHVRYGIADVPVHIQGDMDGHTCLGNMFHIVEECYGCMVADSTDMPALHR